MFRSVHALRPGGRALLNDIEGKISHLAVDRNGHYNLAGRVAVARNMPRVFLHVWDYLGLPRSCCGTTDASTEGDRLAGDFTLERSEDQLALLLRIENVET